MTFYDIAFEIDSFPFWSNAVEWIANSILWFRNAFHINSHFKHFGLLTRIKISKAKEEGSLPLRPKKSEIARVFSWKTLDKKSLGPDYPSNFGGFPEFLMTVRFDLAKRTTNAFHTIFKFLWTQADFIQVFERKYSGFMRLVLVRKKIWQSYVYILSRMYFTLSSVKSFRREKIMNSNSEKRYIQ